MQVVRIGVAAVEQLREDLLRREQQRLAERSFEALEIRQRRTQVSQGEFRALNSPAP